MPVQITVTELFMDAKDPETRSENAKSQEPEELQALNEVVKISFKYLSKKVIPEFKERHV